MEPERDDMPTWDEKTVDRMLRLKRAQQAGMFHEAFDEMFPPDSADELTEGEPERQADVAAR